MFIIMDRYDFIRAYGREDEPDECEIDSNRLRAVEVERRMTVSRCLVVVVLKGRR